MFFVVHKKSKKLFCSFFVAACILFCSVFFCFAAGTKNTQHRAVDDYILVSMTNAYSFPSQPYTPEYFGVEYVKSVKTIWTYDEGDLAEKEDFHLVLSLYLTDLGKEKIDAFIMELESRPDIISAERDHITSAKDMFSKEIPTDQAVPVDDYILVTMEHDYSFSETLYTPEYFHYEFVENVRPVWTYKDGDLVDRDLFHSVYSLDLNEKGKEHIEDLIYQLSLREDILAAERDYRFYNAIATVLPNDPYFQNQYAHSKIMSQKAWAITKGISSVRIGIIDTGVAMNHPDLTPNLSTGLSVNCVNGETGLGSLLMHGTRVAGIVGARGNNNLGIAGVAWYGTVVNLRVMSEAGEITDESVLTALNYAKTNHIRIVNMSLQNMEYNAALKNALDSYAGICVVSAGNNSSSALTYPANYGSACMIVVASTDQNDNLSGFSDYHPAKVHLAAPGEAIYTTVYSSSYSAVGCNGTSFSAPHVTGTLALMKAANPGLTSSQLKSIVLNSVDPISGLSNKVSTGGRLNAFRAVRLAKGYFMGDADLDGEITVDDARQILRWAVGLDSITDLQEALCDVDYSEEIEVEDAHLVLAAAVGTGDPLE